MIELVGLHDMIVSVGPSLAAPSRPGRIATKRLRPAGNGRIGGESKKAPAGNEAAVQARSIPVVRALLGHGADVNTRDRFVRTPLHTLTDPAREIAIPLPLTHPSGGEWRRRGSRSGLLLLRNGADPNLADEHGNRPLDLCGDGWLARTSHQRRPARQTESQ